MGCLRCVCNAAMPRQSAFAMLSVILRSQPFPLDMLLSQACRSYVHVIDAVLQLPVTPGGAVLPLNQIALGVNNQTGAPPRLKSWSASAVLQTDPETRVNPAQWCGSPVHLRHSLGKLARVCQERI